MLQVINKQIGASDKPHTHPYICCFFEHAEIHPHVDQYRSCSYIQVPNVYILRLIVLYCIIEVIFLLYTMHF